MMLLLAIVLAYLLSLCLRCSLLPLLL